MIQAFHPDRSGNPWDVLLDFFGVLLGVLIGAWITSRARVG